MKQIKKPFRELSLVQKVVIVLGIVIFAALIMRIIGDESHLLDEWLGTDGESDSKYQTLRLLALLLAGLVGLFISNRRAKAMEDQAKAQTKSAEAQAKSAETQAKSVDAETKSVEEQVKANRNKTFNEATGHLGHSSASVRLVGIYILYDLALSKHEERLKNIIEILSAHVRATTQEEEYQKKYEKKPSDEISSLLKLLSNLNTNYLSKNKVEKWTPLDLSNAYLCGVRLFQADFRKAIFIRSNFAGAILKELHFVGADLKGSHFVGALLEGSHFEGADLQSSHFFGAHLKRSYFEGANLSYSFFTGAELEVSYFEGAYLYASHFQGAELEVSHFEGANLYGSHFEGAIFEKSHFEGVYGDQDESIGDFKKRIENRKGKKAETGNTMVFAGGITEKYIKDLEKILENTLPHFLDIYMKNSFQQRMKKAIERLKPHQDQSIIREVPKKFKDKNFLGELTKERAEEIIQRYKESMKIHDEIKKKNK